MCAYKGQWCLQNADSNHNTTLVAVLFTNTDLHSSLDNIFVDRPQWMSPLFAYEHDHKQANHFEFLHEHILSTNHGLVIKERLNDIFPLFASCALICVIVHHVVRVKLNHLLDTDNNQIGLLELTEELLQFRRRQLIGFNCVNVPCSDWDCEWKFVFQPKEQRLVTLVVQNDVEA